MDRQEKIEQLIQKLAGEFIERESNRNSLITVTRVFVPTDMKRANIMVTVLPEGHEDNAINFLKRMRGEFKEYFKKHAKVGRIPFFDFSLDKGEKMAQRIRELTTEQDESTEA
jgi:ribosome-binding factor A